LGLAYLDTGSMYRAVVLYCDQVGVDLADPAAVTTATAQLPLTCRTDPADPRLYLNDADISEAIRAPEVSRTVSAVATNLPARRILGQRQRDIIATAVPGIVAEGRDITTVVAPDAAVRILLTASPEARLRRRALEVRGSVDQAALGATADEVLARDARDATVVEFQQAADGVVLFDTSDLDIPGAIQEFLRIVGAFDG
jgi:cytidylate kinase